MNKRKYHLFLFEILFLAALITSCTNSPDPLAKTTDDKTSLPKNSEGKVPLEKSSGTSIESFAELNIYDVSSADWAKGAESIAFISLSDHYPLSEHPDSLAIPDVSELPYDSIQYFSLSGKYRKQFLAKTGVSENDKVFIFNYSSGKLLSFPVKRLLVSALMSIYESENDAPFGQWSYQIGFGINKSLLKAIGDEYYEHVWVSVGKENPFTAKRLDLIAWKKVENEKFPVMKPKAGIAHEMKGFVKLKTYTCEFDSLQIFLQELKDRTADYHRAGRHLLIINKHSGKVELEEFFAEDEGTSMTDLNELSTKYPVENQWVGQLFKNRKPVVFGFTGNSFGCAPIYFIDKTQSPIYIKCDNRH